MFAWFKRKHEESKARAARHVQLMAIADQPHIENDFRPITDSIVDLFERYWEEPEVRYYYKRLVMIRGGQLAQIVKYQRPYNEARREVAVKAREFLDEFGGDIPKWLQPKADELLAALYRLEALNK